MTLLEIKKENGQYYGLLVNESNAFIGKIVLSAGEQELLQHIGDSCVTRIRDIATAPQYGVEDANS